MKLRALVAHHCVRRLDKLLTKCPCQSRLPDAGFSPNQNDLTIPPARLSPSVQQPGDLLLTTDHRRQGLTAMGRFKAAYRPAHGMNSPSMHFPRNTF